MSDLPSGPGVGGSYHHQQASTSSAGSGGQQDHLGRRNSVVIKVGMVGDAQIGKTSLMVKYVEGSFDEDYIQTLGITLLQFTYICAFDLLLCH